MSESGSSKYLSGDTCTASRRVHLCGRVSVHVRILWSTLTLMVTAGCTFSLVQPFWFVHPDTRDSLGLYNYCVRDMRTRTIAAYARTGNAGYPQTCSVHGGHFHLSHLPSNAWQVACVLYGGGCLLLTVASIASIVSFCLSSVWSNRLALYTGYIQTLAAVILVAAIFTFPVGLDSKFAQHYCPGSRMYSAGKCQVGWAYVLGVMSASLSVFCPFLSHYTDFYEEQAVPLVVV